MFFLHVLFALLGFIVFNEVCPGWEETLLNKIEKYFEKGEKCHDKGRCS